MSTNLQQIASSNGNGKAGNERPSSSTRNKKSPYKAVMATKVRWVIVDSRKKLEDAQRQMRMIIEWNSELRKINSLDMRVLAHLGKLDHYIAILALDVGDADRLLGGAIMETKSE